MGLVGPDGEPVYSENEIANQRQIYLRGFMEALKRLNSSIQRIQNGEKVPRKQLNEALVYTAMAVKDCNEKVQQIASVVQIASITLEAVSNLLVKKNIFTPEEIEEEGVNIMKEAAQRMQTEMQEMQEKLKAEAKEAVTGTPVENEEVKPEVETEDDEDDEE